MLMHRMSKDQQLGFKDGKREREQKCVTKSEGKTWLADKISEIAGGLAVHYGFQKLI